MDSGYQPDKFCSALHIYKEVVICTTYFYILLYELCTFVTTTKMQLKTNKSVTIKNLSEESNHTEEKQRCTITYTGEQYHCTVS